MAAVGEHDDAHAGRELRPQCIQLVVDELAIEQHPRLVVSVLGLVPVLVGHLGTVTRVGQQEDVAGCERTGGLCDRRLDRFRRRLLVEEQCRFEAGGRGDRLQFARIVLAPRELAVPTLVVVGIDVVQTEMQCRAFVVCRHEVLLALVPVQ